VEAMSKHSALNKFEQMDKTIRYQSVAIILLAVTAVGLVLVSYVLPRFL
jgi:hypothetical protein